MTVNTKDGFLKDLEWRGHDNIYDLRDTQIWWMVPTEEEYNIRIK